MTEWVNYTALQDGMLYDVVIVQWIVDYEWAVRLGKLVLHSAVASVGISEKVHDVNSAYFYIC